MEELKEGSVVWLKSGGPAMTIEKVQPGDDCNCIWFDGNQISHRTIKKMALTTNNPNLQTVSKQY